MAYETRAFDRINDDGFGPDPIVVMVVTGTHDVARLINLMVGAQPTCEQVSVGRQLVRQVRNHNGGTAALRLLKAHGGPDLLEPVTDVPTQQPKEHKVSDETQVDETVEEPESDEGEQDNSTDQE